MRSRYQCQRAFAFFIVAAISVPSIGSLTAQTPRDSAQSASPTKQPRRFCWQGRPLDRCRSFALFELTLQSFVVGSQLDPVVMRPGFGRSGWDDALASHSFGELGAMRNVSARTALGGTITAGAVHAGGKPVRLVGTTVRYRRWLTPSVSADVGGGIMQLPVGTVVQRPGGLVRGNVVRPALAADLRLGVRDLLAATARLMLATDGQGHTRHALFVGASVGSTISAAAVGTFAAVVLLSNKRGDKVTVQE